MLSVKQDGIKYYFLSLWYDSTWDRTPVSRAIGEHWSLLHYFVVIKWDSYFLWMFPIHSHIQVLLCAKFPVCRLRSLCSCLTALFESLNYCIFNTNESSYCFQFLHTSFNKWFSLKFESQKVSLGLQDSSQYSS